MVTLNNVSLLTPMQIWSTLVKPFLAYMAMLVREVVVMTHSQIIGQMEVMLKAEGFYFKFGMEMSSKAAFWFIWNEYLKYKTFYAIFKKMCRFYLYTLYNQNWKFVSNNKLHLELSTPISLIGPQFLLFHIMGHPISLNEPP